MDLISWCNRIIRSGFYLLFLFVPLILTPWNYELFEYNKMMLTYGLTVLIAGAWLVKMVAERKVRIAKTPLDIPIVLFFLSQLVSTTFSMDPHVSWFGYYSRFNGGMWSVLSYVLLYYAFVSNWGEVTGDRRQVTSKKNKEMSSDISRITYPFDLAQGKHVSRFLKVSLASATVVALYGVLERLGIDKNLWVQDVQNRVFSTLGQPNWLAAYLVALTPIAMAMGFETGDRRQETGKSDQKQVIHFFLVACRLSLVALFFLVLLFTRSRSGLVGLAVADIVFWVLLFFSKFHPEPRKEPRKVRPFEAKQVLLPFVIYHVSFVIIIFLTGTGVPWLDRYTTLSGWQELLTKHSVVNAPPIPTYTAPLLEVGGTESGTIRRYVWQGAINAWKSSPKTMLIGTGTETFAFAFYQYRPKEHNLTSEWDFLYNKAHNEYLNYLATTGIFGLGSYLLLIGAFIFWFVSRIRYHVSGKHVMAHDTLTLDTALFAGWLSILVTNFFGFSVVVTQLFLFLFPAIILSMNYESRIVNHAYWVMNVHMSNKVQRISLFALVLALLVLLALLLRFWQADTLFAAGYRNNRAGQIVRAQPLVSQAIALNPGEPLYHDELGTIYASLTIAAVQNNDATSAATFLARSLAESDKALAISPKNVNFWKSRTKIYYTLSSLDPQYNQAAIVALERSFALSPADPKILYNLAVLSGRVPNNDKAIELLKESINLKPNYRDAYYALYLFYNEVKKPDVARATIAQYLTAVDPTDREFQTKLGQ